MCRREILIVEDDKVFAQTLEDFLEESGFNVTLAYDANEALAKKYFNRYDLCIFDINIPHQNGIDLFADLKESGDCTPTIFVTSYKDIDSLRKCFDIGAHDYLKKPIDLDELLCRIENVFKYINPAGEKVYLSEKCYYNMVSRTVHIDNKIVKLPKKVMLLLELLVLNSNKIVTKDQIIDHIWSASDDFSDGSIRVYINNLKKYIQKDKLVSIKGVGYKFLA